MRGGRGVFWAEKMGKTVPAVRTEWELKGDLKLSKEQLMERVKKCEHIERRFVHFIVGCFRWRSSVISSIPLSV